VGAAPDDAFAAALAASLAAHALVLLLDGPFHHHAIPSRMPLEVRLMQSNPSPDRPPEVSKDLPQRQAGDAPRAAPSRPPPAAPLRPLLAGASGEPGPPDTPQQRQAPVEAVSPAPPAIAAAPTAEPEPAPATPVPTTPADYAAALLRNPKPVYPPSARRDGESGTVVLRVLVSAQGTAAAVEVERSSGVPSLDRAAADTVSRWRFVPARRGGQPVEWHLRIPVEFRIEEP
jgi:protein TonB